MKYIDLDFIKPNKDCVSCDHDNDYTCLCEPCYNKINKQGE